MKISAILRIALLAAPLAFASCRTAQTAVSGQQTATTDTFDRQGFLRKMSAVDNSKTLFATSKIKFSLQFGDQDITLSGNLRMKRNDVIRLQLIAFGIMEAGRIEFTPDYVLVMDRINKQYIKVAYKDVDFLRESGLNFQSLQALFWNELFQPGKTSVDSESLASYQAYMSGSDVAVMLERGVMTYRWMADKGTAQIKTANIRYSDKSHGSTQLTWHYGSFAPFGLRQFPMENSVTVATPSKEIKLGFTLNSIGSDSDWETRTDVSAKYKKVNIDDILRRLSAM